MLNLLPWQRKAFQPMPPFSFQPAGGRRTTRPFAAKEALLALLIGAAIFSPTFIAGQALADVVIQSNGKAVRLHDDGSFSSGPEAVPDMTPGGDRTLSTPPEKVPDQGQETTDTLPYGIVPEVHVPWYPGLGYDRPAPPPGPPSGQPQEVRPPAPSGRPPAPGPAPSGRPPAPRSTAPGTTLYKLSGSSLPQTRPGA